jgi:hypothetical protein
MTTWSKHFQDVSARRSTASFGGVDEECQFTGEPITLTSLTSGDTAKKIGIPLGAGVLAAVFAKGAGLVGVAPILIGVFGAAAAALAVQAMASRVPTPLEVALNPSLAPAPQAASPAPKVAAATAPAPFVGPVQTIAATPAGKPWRVTAKLSPRGDVLLVADVQNALNELGFASPYLVVDGNAGGAGSKTAVAVKRAQAKYGLKQTGSTTDGSLKVALQSAMNDKAGFAQATAAADALAKEMGV